MISRSNYEIYFIDYFDGKLDKIQQEELFGFLKMNPDLKDEFNKYSAFNTEADSTIKFHGKDKLKKDVITNLNYKTWLVGYIENDLSDEQKKDVDNFLSRNSTLKPEFEILKLTRLVPDQNIIFDKKNSLRRDGKIILFNSRVKRIISIAAVLLIISVTYYFLHQVNSPQSMLANNKENDFKKINETKNDPGIIKNDKTGSITIIKNNSESVNLKKQQVSNTRIKMKPVIIKNINEIPMTAMSGELEKFTLKTSDQTITNTGNDSTINKNINPDSAEFIARKNKLIIHETHLKDIFNDEDMKDLKLTSNNESQAISNTETIANLASDGLQKLSKATDISIKKQSDVLNNSVTYALSVGKKVFISRKTTGK